MAACNITMEWYEARKEKNRYRMIENSTYFGGTYIEEIEYVIEPKVEVLIVNRFNNEYDMIYYKSRSFWNENSNEFTDNIGHIVSKKYDKMLNEYRSRPNYKKYNI